MYIWVESIRPKRMCWGYFNKKDTQFITAMKMNFFPGNYIVGKVKRACIKMKKSTETYFIYETFRKKIQKTYVNSDIQHLLILLKCRFVPKGVIHKLKASMFTSAG